MLTACTDLVALFSCWRSLSRAAAPGTAASPRGGWGQSKLPVCKGAKKKDLLWEAGISRFSFYWKVVKLPLGLRLESGPEDRIDCKGSRGVDSFPLGAVNEDGKKTRKTPRLFFLVVSRQRGSRTAFFKQTDLFFFLIYSFQVDPRILIVLLWRSTAGCWFYSQQPQTNCSEINRRLNDLWLDFYCCKHLKSRLNSS